MLREIMGQRLALIIGNSTYLDSTLSQLLAPDADVGALGEILLDPDVGGFDDVKVIINMSSHIIRRTIARFFSKKSRDDLILLYFSGHGVLDDQGHLYLAVRDTDSKLLRGTAISAHYITDEMDNSRSQRQVLILDCCHSGAFARGTKGKTGASVGTAPAFEGTGYGRVVLTASDATQYAWEGDQVIGDAENSLFTHFVLQGIKSGEADINGDGQITIDELYDYVYERVIKHTPKQTPGKWSYKERGEIVIARTPDVVPEKSLAIDIPEFEPDLDEQLVKLYNEGLSAYWLEEWEKAVRCFQAIVETRPDYQDAADKLEMSRRQKSLHSLDERAQAAEDEEDWPQVIARLDELLAIEPDYKGAAERLENAKRNRLLADLYAEARLLSQAGKWRAVVNVFAQIAKLQPDYPDPEGLRAKTEEEVAQLERFAELDEIYNRALREMDAGCWSQAENLLADLQEREPGFKGADRLLERARDENVRQQQALQLEEQVATQYQQALGLARAKQWTQALEKIEAIKALDPKFEDPEGVADQARSELVRQEQEAQRQNQLAEMYAEAVRSLEAGEYQKALEKWGEVQALDPKYPDRKKVGKTARKKLDALSQPTPRWHLSRRTALWAGALLLAVVAAVAGGYLWLNSQRSFLENFDDPLYDGAYNEDQWEMWIFPFPEDEAQARSLGDVAQESDGTGTLKMSIAGHENSINMKPIEFRRFGQSRPTYCETRIRLSTQSSQGSAFLRVWVFEEDGHYIGDLDCFIHNEDWPNQNIECLAMVHEDNYDYNITRISPGMWQTVRIEMIPDTTTFKFCVNDEEFLVLPELDEFRGAQFDCSLMVNNTDESGQSATGYFDYLRIGPITKR